MSTQFHQTLLCVHILPVQCAQLCNSDDNDGDDDDDVDDDDDD